jgi:hypothetical protein
MWIMLSQVLSFDAIGAISITNSIKAV